MFSPSPSTMSHSQFYGGGVAQAPTQAASGGAGPNTTGGQGDTAHIAWLGIVMALIVIRVMYQLGAKVD